MGEIGDTREVGEKKTNDWPEKKMDKKVGREKEKETCVTVHYDDWVPGGRLELPICKVKR